MLHSPTINPIEADLESKLLQTDSQTGKRLVSGASLRDDGEAGDGAVVISRSNLDAGNVCGLV